MLLKRRNVSSDFEAAQGPCEGSRGHISHRLIGKSLNVMLHFLVDCVSHIAGALLLILFFLSLCVKLTFGPGSVTPRQARGPGLRAKVEVGERVRSGSEHEQQRDVREREEKSRAGGWRGRGNQYVSAMTHRCRVFIASGGREGGAGAEERGAKRFGRRPGQHHRTVGREWWREETETAEEMEHRRGERDGGRDRVEERRGGEGRKGG